MNPVDRGLDTPSLVPHDGYSTDVQEPVETPTDAGRVASAGERIETPGLPARIGQILGAAWAWFRAFRRTRPFWGGLFCILGGAWIIRWMSFTFFLAVNGGWDYSAGYILGGGMILMGLVSWFAPFYHSLTGILAFMLALAAFVAANLGGFVLGTVLGIVGGSMIWAWGEKSPAAAVTQAAAEDPDHADHAAAQE